MTTVANLAVRLSSDPKNFIAGMSSGERGLNKFKLAAAAAGAVLIAIAVKVAAAVTGMAAAFDKGMREVNTLLRLPEAAFQSLKAEALDFAGTMGLMTSDVVPALYQAISAGVPKQNVFEFMEVAAQAAIGGVTDLETSVDIITTVINNFSAQGLTALQAADALFTTVRLGKTTFDQLAVGIQTVLPISAAAGVTFDEVAAAMAVLTAKTGQTAESATKLRSAIEAMVAPTIRTKKRLEELGVGDLALTVKTQGLQAAFERLRKATDGNLETLRKLLGSTEAVQAVLLLTGENADSFTSALGAMTDKAGASQAAFEEMEKTVQRMAERIKAQLNVAMIEFGTKLLPLVEKALKTLLFILERVPAPVLAGAAALVAATVALAGLMLLLPAATAMLVGFKLAWAFAGLGAIGLVPVLVAAAAALVVFGAAILIATTLTEDFAAAEREAFAGADIKGLKAQRVALLEQIEATEAGGLSAAKLQIAMIDLNKEIAEAPALIQAARDDFFLLRDALIADAEAMEAVGRDASELREEIRRLTRQFNEARSGARGAANGLQELEEALGATRGTFDAVISDVQELNDELTALERHAKATAERLSDLARSREEISDLGAAVSDPETARLIQESTFGLPTGALAGDPTAVFDDIEKNTKQIAENTRQGPGGLLEILIARRLAMRSQQDMGGTEIGGLVSRREEGDIGDARVGARASAERRGGVTISIDRIDIGAGARTTAGEIAQGFEDGIRGRLADQVGE